MRRTAFLVVIAFLLIGSPVVANDGLGFVTGGGWFYWPGTADRTNFTFNVRYNTNLDEVIGSLMIVRQSSDNSIIWVREKAFDGLAVGSYVDGFWASFSGRCTFFPPDGGATAPEFLMYVEDNGKPGSGVDRIWIYVNGLPASFPDMTMDFEAVDNTVEIQRGNIIVQGVE